MRSNAPLWLRAALVALAVSCTLAPMVWAQSTGATLSGKVVDANGGALPGAAVTATDKSTGFTRSTSSDTDGTFRLGALPPGTYAIEAALDGYATITVDAVKLDVGAERQIRIDMRQASVEETITVTTEEPLVETTPAIGTVVSQNELESLPLNGRQFANLAVLAPGTQLAYNSDPTKPGQLTVALNGGIGRNVNFTVDGGDNTDDTIGGALQNFNLESVQEFRIQTMQYKAEYGRSSGGVLAVVTKTGTNEFQGSGWEYYRDKSLNAKTESEKLQGLEKGAYSRDQYGAAIGGPLVRDKAHFFGTYEKTDRTTAIGQALGVAGVPGDGTVSNLPFTDELATAKATWNISAEQYLQVRYGYQKNSDKYGASPLSTPDSFGTVSNKYESYLGGHTWQIGGDSLNEAIFQYTKFDNLISADSTNPYLYFPSGAHTGQNVNTPQSTHQVKYQYRDDFSFVKDLWNRQNAFKVGAQYVHEPTLGGDFSTGTSGQFSFLSDSINSPITDITYFGGFFGNQTPIDQYSVYLQDDVTVNDRLTINLGIRYDLWNGFDLNQASNPIFQTLRTQTTYNEVYLRDFHGAKDALDEDNNNWAPRIGFTYDLRGDGKHLLRGGYGTYYDFPYTNATILFPAAAVQSNYGVAYNVNNPAGIRNPDGSFYRIGQPLPPNQLPGTAVNPPNEVASPTLATPYSDQASLGYSWQVNPWLGLNLEAVTIDYHDIPYRFRANGKLDANGNVIAAGARRFPQFGNFRIWYGNGRASYDGVNIGARVRRPGFELQAFYTYSKTDGNVLAGADEFRITDVGHQPSLSNARDASINFRDPGCSACFGPLYTDSKHKITLGGTWVAPWQIKVSGMYRYRSGQPYTLVSNNDLNGDGFRMDLSPGVSSVSSKRGGDFQQFDLRLSRDFTFGNWGFELLAEMFNVFNDKNANGFRPDYDLGPNSTTLEPTTFAGDPGQGEQQLVQLGLRLHFG